jgi:hypothetical protein
MFSVIALGLFIVKEREEGRGKRMIQTDVRNMKEYGTIKKRRM